MYYKILPNYLIFFQINPGVDWDHKASNKIYKGHKDNAKKASNSFEKASISLKKSSKIIEILIKAPHF
jgi:hypothetical protein